MQANPNESPVTCEETLTSTSALPRGMEPVRRKPRPRWLKLWLAFATAVFIFRISSGTAWFIVSIFDKVFHFPPLGYLYDWGETAIIVLAVCTCVVAERCQEAYFASKSVRTNVICAVILTILALIPLKLKLTVDYTVVSSPPTVNWTFAFRLAAEPSSDAAIIKVAQSSDQRDVKVDNQLVAIWILVVEDKALELESNTSLVTRRNSQGDLEVLTLKGPFDVSTRDMIRTWPAIDGDGRPTVGLRLDERGAEKMGRLTGRLGRHLVIVLNGRAKEAIEVKSRVGTSLIMPGDFSQAEVDQLTK